jgi:hypothetical protein
MHLINKNIILSNNHFQAYDKFLENLSILNINGFFNRKSNFNSISGYYDYLPVNNIKAFNEFTIVYLLSENLIFLKNTHFNSIFIVFLFVFFFGILFLKCSTFFKNLKVV